MKWWIIWTAFLIGTLPVCFSTDLVTNRKFARVCAIASVPWFIFGLVLAYFHPIELEPVMTVCVFAIPLVYLLCFQILRVVFRHITREEPYITDVASIVGQRPISGLFRGGYGKNRRIRLSDFVFSFAQVLIPIAILGGAFLHFSPPVKKKFPGYPATWFMAINDPNKPDWEILPQEAKAGEVILSKRNELGILSNFAATPFEMDGKRYASVEGFWQMMLYPEGPDDERAKDRRITWKYTREQVAQMTAFEAKQAGMLAEENMNTLGIDWGNLQWPAIYLQIANARRTLPARHLRDACQA